MNGIQNAKPHEANDVFQEFGHLGVELGPFDGDVLTKWRAEHRHCCGPNAGEIR